MSAIYIILKVSALLAIIIIPLFGPKKRKSPASGGLSNLAVNESGYLETFSGSTEKHHLVL